MKEAVVRDPCPFCGGTGHMRVHSNLYNKRKPDFGPFDFFECKNCGSGLTLPPPSAEDLAALYNSLQFGLSAFARELLADGATYHQTCLQHIVELSGLKPVDSFTWMEIGAGGGEMAAALTKMFPAAKGTALDIHDRPPALGRSDVDWIKLDIGDENFAERLALKAELVLAIGVWEHVRQPDLFIRNALAMMASRSMLYLNTPNYGSWARRLMGRRWPYWYPGEHIFMPSLKGARRCLEREAGAKRARVLVRPVNLLFSLRYVSAKLISPQLARLFPAAWSMRFPAGDLEAVLWLDGDAPSSGLG